MRLAILIAIAIAVPIVGWWMTRETPANVPAPAPAKAVQAPAAGPATVSFTPQFSVPPTIINDTASGSQEAAPPLQLGLIANINFPGEKPGLTVMFQGYAITIREGDTFGPGFRVDKIEKDRIFITHVPTGKKIEQRFDEMTGGQQVVASVAPSAPLSTMTPSPGIMPATRNAAPSGAGPAAAARATPPPASSFTPPVSNLPPRAPPGATVNDNPLVGAILPTSPGVAPAGIDYPRPVPLAPGQAVPQGPKPQPIPANAQGPVPR